MGNIPTLIISDAEMIKQITVKEFSKFTNRAVSVFYGGYFYNSCEWNNSLFSKLLVCTSKLPFW